MYKQGQGQASRAGAAGLGVFFSLYAGYSWYGWWAGTDVAAYSWTGIVGGVAIALALSVLLVMVAFQFATSGDYLIDMDTELRKVVWPEVTPLFDPKTKAWGSTYIVIAFTLFLASVLAVLDLILHFTVARTFLGWLLSQG